MGELGILGMVRGIFCPNLGPPQKVEDQGPPEASVSLERPEQEGREERHLSGEVPLGAGSWRLSLIHPLSSGHPAETEWQVPEQGVEEEVCNTL